MYFDEHWSKMDFTVDPKSAYISGQGRMEKIRQEGAGGIVCYERPNNFDINP